MKECEHKDFYFCIPSANQHVIPAIHSTFSYTQNNFSFSDIMNWLALYHYHPEQNNNHHNINSCGEVPLDRLKKNLISNNNSSHKSTPTKEQTLGGGKKMYNLQKQKKKKYLMYDPWKGTLIL